MSKIQEIRAFEILDSRGNPTIEATVRTKHYSGTASVPSGASKGDHEACALRDNATRYNGLGVQKAVRNVEKIIAPLLKGKESHKQRALDNLMIKRDGSSNKSTLGANAMLAVSLACARTAAKAKKKELYRYLATLSKQKPKRVTPFFNVINGGKHADNKLSFQEFMIVPQMRTFREDLRVGVEVYHMLKKDLHKKYGKGATNVGDEGGFAPLKLVTTKDALTMLQRAIKNAGYKGKVKIAIDAAASEFFDGKNYHVDGKKMSAAQLEGFYLKLIAKYPIISIEDPFDQEEFARFASLRKKTRIQIVGDDLTVTNVKRIQRAIEEKSCTTLLLKMNQIGTLSETLDAVRLAYKHKWKVMVSHRSGDTTDTFIADLAVGIGCSQIKAGAPCRGERVAKYNRLLQIEQELRGKKR